MKDPRKWMRGATAIALALGAAPAEAQEAPNASAPAFNMGETVVTGARSSPAETVGQEEMRRFDAGTVSEAANLLPGVTLARNGARNESMLYVHGFDLKHVPLFLDGIPVYVPYDGYPDLGRFYTYDLSRLDVSRGFTSVLYGPNTMGGALNLITRRPTRPLEGDLGADAASGWGGTAWANLGARQERFYEQISGSWEHSDGFSLSHGFRPAPGEDGGTRNNSYHRDWKVSGKVGFTSRERDEYAVGVSIQHGVKGTPPYAGTDPAVALRFWQWPYWDKQSIYAATRTALGAVTDLESRVYFDKFQNSLYAYDDATYSTMNKKSSFKSQYDDTTYGGSLKGSTEPLAGNALKAALHFKADVHREHNLPNPWQHFEDYILSAGMEDTQRLAKWLRLVAGMSFDRLETVHAQDYSTGTMVDFPKGTTSAWNPQAGVFVKPFSGAEAHAAVSRKSRLPSIKDKYSYRLGTAIPNPDLRPEHAVNYEAGWDHRLWGGFRYSGTAYFHDVTDFVQTVTVPDPTDSSKVTTQNQNVGKVHQYGVEALLSYARGEWLEAGLAYAWLHAENLSNDQKLTGIPAHKATGYVRAVPFKLLQAMVLAEYDSRRFSSTDGKRIAGEYLVLGAKLSSEPIPNLLVEAAVENLLDKSYALDEGYPEPGRTFFVQTRYRF